MNSRVSKMLLAACLVLPALGGCAATAGPAGSPGQSMADALAAGPAAPSSQPAARTGAGPAAAPVTPAQVMPGPAGAIATVNGRPLPYEAWMNLMRRSHGLSAFQQILALELARQGAEAKGITLTQADLDAAYRQEVAEVAGPETKDAAEADRIVKAVLARRGVGLDEFRLAAYRNAYLRRVAEPMIEPGITEDALKVEFDRLHGAKVQITNYGGIVVRLYAPDRKGHFDDVVLGYDKLDGYVKETPYFGAIVGRYGNRIAGGKFTLDGKEYTLPRNDHDINTLHGGKKGFDKKVWDAQPFEGPDGAGLKLEYLSKDGEEGFPGNLKCTVRYTFTARNELKIEYRATTDKPTPVNLTNHSYWNLTAAKRDILAHELMINADKFTPVDKNLIPTGKLEDVTGTPFDFRKPTAIGARINDDNEQLKFGKGYDHNFVLNRTGQGMVLAATVYEPNSGRFMEVLTTEPGVQFYSGNFLDGSITGKGGIVYKNRWALCLETQHYPDSPNQPNFPSTVLKPGEEYHTTTIYRFSAK